MAHAIKDEVAKMLSRCPTCRLGRTGINRTDAIVVETQKDDQQRGTAMSSGLLSLGKHKSKTFELVGLGQLIGAVATADRYVEFPA